jgi:hypothetical protein
LRHASPSCRLATALRGGYDHYGVFEAGNYFFMLVILLFTSTKATFGVKVSISWSVIGP